MNASVNIGCSPDSLGSMQKFEQRCLTPVQTDRGIWTVHTVNLASLRFVGVCLMAPPRRYSPGERAARDSDAGPRGQPSEEFHFVCGANYTRNFYHLRDSSFSLSALLLSATFCRTLWPLLVGRLSSFRVKSYQREFLAVSPPPGIVARVHVRRFDPFASVTGTRADSCM